MKINKITPDGQLFTKGLADIANPPKSLCYIGTLPDDRPPVVAIVGSRKPTNYGREVTERLSYNLAKKGVVIVSGLALGVDAIAHQAALDANGTTLAIVTNELPDISPRTNYRLAMKIIESNGAIISEWQRGDEHLVQKWGFLERNRLVSGLADAVIITEAAARSGTLNTAGHALNQGRDLFVVPGNITSPLSAGCNALLKQGAYPVTEASDILDVIAPQLIQTVSTQASLPLGDTPAENAVLKLIVEGIRDGEQLQQRSGLNPADFAGALTMLEINGIIKPLGANTWCLR